MRGRRLGGKGGQFPRLGQEAGGEQERILRLGGEVLVEEGTNGSGNIHGRMLPQGCEGSQMGEEIEVCELPSIGGWLFMVECNSCR